MAENLALPRPEGAPDEHKRTQVRNILGLEDVTSPPKERSFDPFAATPPEPKTPISAKLPPSGGAGGEVFPGLRVEISHDRDMPRVLHRDADDVVHAEKGFAAVPDGNFIEPRSPFL